MSADKDARDLTIGPGGVPVGPPDLPFLEHEEGRKLTFYVPPGDASGATTGWGWDFGERTEDDVRRVWGPRVDAALLAKLLRLVGKKGAAARVAIIELQGVKLPGEAVDAVFLQDSVPEYQARMDAAYTPAWRLLPKPVQDALFSLTYNRGGLATLSKTGESREGESTDGDRYDNERGIRMVITDHRNPLEIADYLEQMAQDGPGTLWPGATPPNPGLRGRRRREAGLIRAYYSTH